MCGSTNAVSGGSERMRAKTTAAVNTNTSNNNHGLPCETDEAVELDEETAAEDRDRVDVDGVDEAGSARSSGEAAGVRCGSFIDCPLAVGVSVAFVEEDSWRVRTSPA